MKFFLACGVWLVMAILLGTGMVLAMHGTYWVLTLSLLLFAAGAAVIGCRQY